MLNGITTGWRSWTRAATAGRREASTSADNCAGIRAQSRGSNSSTLPTTDPGVTRKRRAPSRPPRGQNRNSASHPGRPQRGSHAGRFLPPRSPRVRTTRLRQTRTTELNANESKGSVLTPMPDEPRHNRRDAPFAVSQASQTRAPNAPTLTSSFLSRKRRKSTFQA